MKNLKKIAREIQKRDNFWLISHAIPDGDSIGSLLALGQALTAMGKKTGMVLKDPVPHIYNYLRGSEQVLSPDQVNGELSQVIFLDCADRERAGEEVLKLIAPDCFSINIDHHESNTCFADLNCIQPRAAATGEIIYQLLKVLDIKIEPAMANALYAAIIQDTGSFQHNNTTPATFRIAADLLECGADLELTKIKLFESKKREEICLLGHALNGIQFSPDGKLAWMSISFEDAKRLGVIDLHPEGIINHTLKVEGVEVGLLFREIRPKEIKVGFRSKGAFDVSRMAALYEGGGHRQAAGAQVNGDLEACIENVVQTVRDVIT
ncbi:Phosphoesterase, DHHA1 [Syntrophomonas zehnderi OL-4]|uniref:Phosphoesterase, DHHA1 n=1 Tax=Syntrophomonas zehnderi OL-4 TaxID=690567 RepID=A0A0E3W3A6_9FIRM|nr:bifunctional oligoribonuclease/PAP phosphatase NrnA [Syntrophomonas zehnderi]CFX67730.1 Phosphoesterase, DHHA1 [Syntrophomonas zehnderi OL-4]